MVSQIVDLVEEAASNKGKSEKFITKFSKIYTPAVIILAIAFALITSVFGALEVQEAIRRSLIFLVASCPCSLVISVPLAFFACVGSSSKKGMLIKGTKHIENLAKADIIAFDKTGTLTTGKMEIDTVEAFGNYTKEEVLTMIASLEKLSNHPIAKAIISKVDEEKILPVDEYKEIAGHGIYGKINGVEAVCGNKKLLEKYKIEGTGEDKIYLAVSGKIAGAITMKEEVLEENKEAMQKINLQKVMLTGDGRAEAEKIAKEYGIEEVYSSLLPNQKQEIIQELKKDGDKVIFLGDGINDAPVLAEADFGISMGMGTEIANTTSDAILMSNQIKTIPKAIAIAKKTMRIVKTNIIFSLLAKAIVLILRNVRHSPNLASSTSRHRSNIPNSSKFHKNNGIENFTYILLFF